MPGTAEALVHFQTQGYAVLPSVMTPEQVRRLRADVLDPAFDSKFAQRCAEGGTDPGERIPIGAGREGDGAFAENAMVANAAAPLLLDPRVLAFAEEVLADGGVQLDSFRVTCFPSLPPDHQGEVHILVPR